MRSVLLFLALILLVASSTNAAKIKTTEDLVAAMQKRYGILRCAPMMNAFRCRPSELLFVLDTAVDCRNHYVHGTSSRIDYSKNSGLVVFLTDTLVFVFGASELVEAGWDIQRFAGRGSTMTHPYGSYLATYKSNLQALKALINHGSMLPMLE